ncbi:hypothetical protein V6N13_107884 [Hibiscus sabdariffa]
MRETRSNAQFLKPPHSFSHFSWSLNRLRLSAPKSVPKDIKWFTLDSESIKLNFDAFFNLSSASLVSGLIVRYCLYLHMRRQLPSPVTWS